VIEFFVKRLLLMVLTLVVVSVVSFAVIELPPGDYLTAYAADMRASGQLVSQADLAALEKRYGLNLPLHQRYLKWVGDILQGDFGYSFGWNKPVSELIWGRLGLTVMVTLSTLIFTWIVGFGIGVYSATHQYSPTDYTFTAISFIGLGLPNFLIAMVLMWVGYRYFDADVGGLFSQEYLTQPWSWAKFVNMLGHLWVPIVVLGVGGTASMIRIMRANLLDELRKPYVTTGRSKGLRERRLLMKYPVRVALNPFVSTAGWALPRLISGATIVSVVLGLPTTGPLLLSALTGQDMYLAASFVLLLSALTIIGTFISDIVLAWLDPRVREAE
jgi:peptide/nickel transport system permease protein